jgi:hypothetical protein
MEFLKYGKVPGYVAEALKAEHEEKKKDASK